MKILKKNQLLIIVIALMLVTAGYLNYTANDEPKFISTSGYLEDENLASIGDAALVNSNNIVENEVEKKDDTNSNSSIETNAKTQDDDYFTASKLNRDNMYSQMIETYQKQLDSNQVSETQKSIATQEIKKINEIKNAIMIAENLIKTKGFEEVVIFVNDSSISVVVKSEKLSQEQIAQLQNIISRELNVKVENIHISNK